MSSPELPNLSKNTVAQEDIAIIGMACLFPSAPDVQTYWQNIVAKVDAVTDPPTEAWDSDIYYDPDSPEDDRVYCKRGGYIGPLAYFDPLKHGVIPTAIDGSEPEQWLALQVAYDALANAGYRNRIPEAERTAVILGKGTYLNHGNLSMVQRGLVVDQTIEIIKTLCPEFTKTDLKTIRQELKQCLPSFSPETAQGLIPNVIAGRIANRLNLMGPCYTVDGACASSLLALEIAIRDLSANKIDLAIIGGSQVSTPVPILGLFCQINALSHRQQIRPFDKDADGTILGEGIGMIVLKRRSDAKRDGNRIYALIKGVGSSSDGRGLSVMAPRAEGEELALRRAYEMADVSPRTIGLIEAHGTGTPAGDLAEIQALKRVFGPRQGNLPWCAIGSVKSMISHTLPAAGIAGIIKAALSLYHKVLPPTLNVDEPNPKFELEKTPFYINTETRPWIHGSNEAPRRAGVNAFGFGGVNAHVILEENPVDNESNIQSLHHYWETEVCILEGKSRSDVIDRIKHLQKVLISKQEAHLKDIAYTLNTNLKGAPYRLSLIASSLEDLQKKLERGLIRLNDPGCKQIKDVKGIYFFEKPLYSKGKIAFLFPGEGAQYVNMLSDLCIHFPEVRSNFDRMDRIFAGHARGYLPSEYIFPAPSFSTAERKIVEERLWKMDGAVESVLIANNALFNLLSRLEIRPDVVLGHSTGEYSAMRASGIFNLIDDSDNGKRALDLNRSYEKIAAKNEIPRAKLIAVSADSASVATFLDRVNAEIYIGMDNCPHQTVIAVTEADVQKVIEELNHEELIYQILPFDRPYHTPLFKRFAATLRQFFARWPVASPTMPIYSCTAIATYPSDPDEIRKLAVDHWLRPVEVGPKGNLTAFVDDILRGQDYAAIPANVQHRSGITQLNHVVGFLAAHAVPMKFDYIYERRAPQQVSLNEIFTDKQTNSEPTFVKKLLTGWPSMRISSETIKRLRPSASIHQPNAFPPSSDSTMRNEELSSQSVPPAPESVSDKSEPASGLSGKAAYRQGSDGKTMSAYFETMEHFLEVQEEVMRTLFGAAGNISKMPPRPAVFSPDLPSLPLVNKAEVPVTKDDVRHDHVQMIDERLLEIVSEKTGYPKEMLDLNLDMEADLGIDSIKRTEILGAFSEQHNVGQDRNMEKIAGLKTLQQVIDFFQSHLEVSGNLAANTPQSNDKFQAGNREAMSANSIDISSFPMIGEVVSLVPGRELEALRQISMDNDLYLRDHALGGKISCIDDALMPLPVMPLTLSMEIMAEAGALLVPGKALVRMSDIHAYRWIMLEGKSLTLRIIARIRPDAPDEVDVQIYDTDETELIHANPVMEGTMIFSSSYPQAPAVDSFSLCGERASRWSPEQLYTKAMFHGPSWQGVSSVERWGEDGSIATLKVLSTDQFFRSKQNPEFVTDPIVLDAAGQIVGFWTMEHLERGFLVFPYRVKNLHIYRSRLPEHQKVRCHARIKLVGAQQVSSDIDMIGEDGQLWMRLEAWEDKRFDLPSSAHAFLLSPVKAMPSIPWNAPLDYFPNANSFSCCRIETLFQGDEAFWRSVFAQLLLNHNEKQIFRNLGKSKNRQIQWLMGRLVAKDAVRMFLKQRYKMELGPADVEIAQDEYGCPVPQGAWAKEIKAVPALSLAHTNGIAVAIAGYQNTGQRIGIDIEEIRSLEQGFETTAFAPKEVELLDSITESARQQWLIRFWSAKEAAAKALGRGLAEGPQSLAVQALDVKTGIVKIALKGKLAEEFPDLARTTMIVYTGREEKHIFASTICERN
jgi:phosphopantetheine--protein transferase-like protein